MLYLKLLFTFLSAPVKLLVVLTPPKISQMMSLHSPVCTLLCITQCSQLVDDPSWCAQMQSTSSPSWWWIVWRLRTGSMMSCSLAQASNYSSLDMVYDHHWLDVIMFDGFFSKHSNTNIVMACCVYRCNRCCTYISVHSSWTFPHFVYYILKVNYT